MDPKAKLCRVKADKGAIDDCVENDDCNVIESDEEEEDDTTELSERTVRKIANLKLEMQMAKFSTVFDVKQLLLKDAEHYRKLKLSKTIDNIANSHQKELIASSILQGEQSPQLSALSKGDELRNDWIMRAVAKKKVTTTIHFDDEDATTINNPNPTLADLIIETPPILEGQLQRFRPGIINSWKTVYCILHEDRLQIFQETNKNKSPAGSASMTSSIPAKRRQLKVQVFFKHFKTVTEYVPATATSQAGFTLKINFTDITITLRDLQQSQQQQQNSDNPLIGVWASKIEAAIKKQSDQLKFKMEPSILTSLSKSELILESEFYAKAQSGDIVLFETKSMAAAFQRGATSSKFDHVGMVIRLSDGQIRIFDAVGQGVSLTEWNKFLYENGQYHSIVYRPLQYENREAVLPELYTFVEKTIGSKYSLNLMKLAKMSSNVTTVDSNKKKSYFCSELIAKAFKEMGIISIQTASSQYWPRSFSENYDGMELKFYDKATLGKEQMVLLNIEILGKSH